MLLEFTLNGQKQKISEVPGHQSLLHLLRDGLGLLGTKEGCGVGECGACTVLLDNQPVNACLVPAWKVQGRTVMTIEGVAPEDGLHPIQEAFIETGAIQCGYCTPGMILSTYSLLKRSPDPKDQEIKTALSGNLCRCTGYKDIQDAVRLASVKIRGDKHD
jgi:aerobic-type carbon monoxide dehydrogenase small subunit (CoxS/CutS family)